MNMASTDFCQIQKYYICIFVHLNFILFCFLFRSGAVNGKSESSVRSVFGFTVKERTPVFSNAFAIGRTVKQWSRKIGFDEGGTLPATPKLESWKRGFDEFTIEVFQKNIWMK